MPDTTTVDITPEGGLIFTPPAGKVFKLVAVEPPPPPPPVPPVANFTALPTIGAAPLDVQFTDISTGDITSYAWNFGDGSTSTTQHPAYTYTVPGTFSVTLTVTGPGGTSSKTGTIVAEAVVVPPTPTKTVWIDHDVLMNERPTSGAAWENIAKRAAAYTGAKMDVSDQDSTVDAGILYSAYAGVRTNNQTLKDKALAGLMSAIDTEATGKDSRHRWLAVGRNMPNLIIATHVLGITSGPVYDWIMRFKTRTLAHDNTGKQITLKQAAWSSASNAPSQEGTVLTLLAAFSNDPVLMAYCADCYNRYIGDTNAAHEFEQNDFGTPWQVNDTPRGRVAILPVGATINGILVDGWSTNDAGRSNPNGPHDPLTYNDDSLYPWVGINGAVDTGVVLDDWGWDAFGAQQQALKRFAVRAVAFKQQFKQDWWYTDKKVDAKHFLIKRYKLPAATYPLVMSENFLIAGVDWTHPNGA